jgi:Bacterial Ig-like domain (group 3)/Bacterial Ig domain
MTNPAETVNVPMKESPAMRPIPRARTRHERRTRSLRPRGEILETRTLLSLPALLPVIALDPSYGEVAVNGVAVDSSGDIFITGTIFGSSINLNPDGSSVVSTDLTKGFVAKYSPQGTLLWDQPFFGTYGGGGNAITLDAQGDPIVTGTEDAGIYVAEFNGQTGQNSWTHVFGDSASDSGNAITVSPFGSIFVTGAFSDSSISFASGASPLVRKGTQDGFIIELNTAGDVIMATDIGEPGYSGAGRGITVDSSNNIYITGSYSSASSAGALFVSELNSSGTEVWLANDASGSSADSGNGIALDGLGDVYVVGTVAGTTSFGGNVGSPTITDPSDLFLLKVNASDGESLQLQTIGNSTGSSDGNALVVSGGTVYVTGAIQSTVSGTNVNGVLLAAYDAATGAFVASSNTEATGTSAGGSAIAANSLGKIALTGEYAGGLGFSGSDGSLPTTPSGRIGDFVAATGLVPPVAQNESYSAAGGQTLTVSAAQGVLSNDTAPAGLSLSVSSHTNPSHGTLDLNADGSFTYTPSGGFSGQDTFTYTIADGTDLTATGTVTITVQPPTISRPTITWAAPAAITYGTPLGGAQLDATATYGGQAVAGTFAYSLAPGTILGAGSHTLSVIFTPTDTTDYQSVSAQTTLIVDPATPAIDWPAPAVIAYGTALGVAQLDATATLDGTTVPGTFVYSPAAGTVLDAGSQTLSVTFTPTDGTDYQSVSAQATITVIVFAAQPTITTEAATAIAYTTATLGASVDPDGETTNVTFLYGTNPTLYAAIQTPAQAIGSGAAAVAVDAALTGLQPGTAYYYEAVATTSNGTYDGAILSFTTPAVSPVSPATTTMLAVSVNPSTVGQPVTFTAIVTTSANLIPTGTVTLMMGGTALATAGLGADGQAIFSVSSLPPGVDVITARYSGDANFQGSTSAAVVQLVQALAPPPPPPSVVQAEPLVIDVIKGKGRHARSVPEFAGFEIVFNEALSVSGAQSPSNYLVEQAVRRGRKTIDEPVAVNVQYNPADSTVDLLVVGKPRFADGGQLSLNAAGFLSSAGEALVGQTAFTILAHARGVA